MNLKKSVVSRLLLRVKNEELIEKAYTSITAFWKLTDKGKAFLEMGDKGIHQVSTALVFRRHNLIFNFKVVGRPENFDDILLSKGWILSKKHTYLTERYKLNGLGLLEFTPHALILKPEPIYARSIDEAIGIGLERCRAVQDTIEEAFSGLRLGIPTFTVTREHIAIESEVWENNFEDKCFARNDMFQVDASKGTPEFEAHRSKYASGDIQKFLDLVRDFVKNDVKYSDLAELKDFIGQSVELQSKLAMKVAKLENSGSTVTEGSVPVNSSNEDVR
jgi:hypothetical protein